MNTFIGIVKNKANSDCLIVTPEIKDIVKKTMEKEIKTGSIVKFQIIEVIEK